MALAEIGAFPRDLAGWASWSFQHMVNHRDINRLIAQKANISLPEYVLDPINLKSMGLWNQQHYLMHTNQNNVLNIQGVNLEDVDWSDEDSIRWFLQVHFEEHYAASRILGLE